MTQRQNDDSDLTVKLQQAVAAIDVAALGKVAVLFGGRSGEREVSLMSGQGVLAALRSLGVDAHPFDPAERPLEALKAEGFSRAFIALHGRYGEDGSLQGALELLGIPYTGSGVLASALAMDKIMTKRVWRAHQLPTPDFMTIQSEADLAEVVPRLGLPVMFKAAHEGSTLGIVRVQSAAELVPAWRETAALDADVLAEAFVQGRELTVVVMGSGADAFSLPIIEIIAPQGNYDFFNKYYSDDTRYECPAPLSEALTAQIREIAVAAYRAVGCETWGRVDFMLGTIAAQGQGAGKREVVAQLLEVNTSPGMTPHSLVPMAARQVGMAYPELCLYVLSQASLKIGRTQMADTPSAAAQVA